MFLYPSQGYIQIAETFPGEIEPEVRQSAVAPLLEKLEEFLDPSEVILQKETFLPEDFRESDDGESIRFLS